jgi:signal peptidase II
MSASEPEHRDEAMAPEPEAAAAAPLGLDTAMGPADEVQPPATPVFSEAGTEAPIEASGVRRAWPGLWPAHQVATGFGWIACAIAAGVVTLDQLSKFWVTEVLDLEYRPPIQVLSFFRLTMVHNQGVSFGLFKAHADTMRWVLVAFSVLVVALLIGWARKVERRLTAVALGLIIGGAIGNNWIDRVRFGWVVDFLDVSGLHFPWVFNVADSAISVGVALLLLDSVLRPDGGQEKA